MNNKELPQTNMPYPYPMANQDNDEIDLIELFREFFHFTLRNSQTGKLGDVFYIFGRDLHFFHLPMINVLHYMQ